MTNRREFLLQGIAVTAATATGLTYAQSISPVRIAIYGLVHDHAWYMMDRLLASKSVKLAGIIETDRKLIARYSDQFHLEPGMFFPALDALVAATNVQAIGAFTSTFDHREVVERCAPRGIHVMMEKPFAVNGEHARAMAVAAKKGGIQLLVNYDTSWYPSVQRAVKWVLEDERVGKIHKVVVRAGHSGPEPTNPAATHGPGPGTSAEFLSWLTDPRLNGGGVVMDFGCYGADLLTVLMRDQRPTSVSALTQTFRPDLYPRVDDEATIVVAYPQAVRIIQGSWNWPIERKDMDIYGAQGEVSVINDRELVYRESDVQLAKRQAGALSADELNGKPVLASPPAGPNADEFEYLAAVVRREIKPSGPSSLKTNLIVTEILDAARLSARSGRRIDLRKDHETT